ncbi:MAG: Cof-type HAD-IIB family hydrolase [Clostridia bacterium]
MYKLVAIDLDGTLLNSNGEVSIENKKAIEEAMRRSVKIVIASGRVTSSVENIAKEIGTSKYIISGNGSLVYDTEQKEILYNKYIKKEKILEIIQICEENSIYYSIYTEDAILTKSLNYSVLVYHKENSKKAEEKKTIINIVKDCYQYVKESKKNNFLKITICDDNPIIFQGIMRKLKSISDIDVLEVAHMSRKTIKSGTEEIPVEYYYTEITSKNVDKWYAIEFLMQKLKIQKEDVMAIGDNINDKKMIEEAGLGIAMGGSTPQLTEIANMVVSDNNSNGVAEAITRYILGK